MSLMTVEGAIVALLSVMTSLTLVAVWLLSDLVQLAKESRKDAPKRQDVPMTSTPAYRAGLDDGERAVNRKGIWANGITAAIGYHQQCIAALACDAPGTIAGTVPSKRAFHQEAIDGLARMRERTAKEWTSEWNPYWTPK